MKALKEVLFDCVFDEDKQTTLVNLINKTAASEIPQFYDRTLNDHLYRRKAISMNH